MAASRRLQKVLDDLKKAGNMSFKNVQVDESSLQVWQGLLEPDEAPYNKKMGSGEKNPALLYFSIFLSAIGGFLFGYDTGVIAGAMPLVEKTPGFFPADKKDSDDWVALITAITVGVAFIFSFVGGWLTDKFGRRPAILFASLVFTAGAVVMGAAPTKEILLVGRIIVGMGIGVASMSVPVYMSETSPESIRGFLGASFQVMICFGGVIAALIDALFGMGKSDNNGWKFDFGLAGVPSLILLVGFFFCPESPRWLAQQGRNEQALDVLKRLRPASWDSEKELEEIVKLCKEDEAIAKETGGNPFARMLREPAVRKAVLVGCSLQLFQQLSGINTVIYYSARILMMSGISNDVSIVLWISCGVNAINFFASFIGMSLADRVGRRLLTLLSYLGICISLIIIGMGFQLSKIHSPSVTLPSNSTCGALSTCYDCTYEYDTHDGEDLKCGFCYDPSDSGQSSCVAWNVEDNENIPTEGRCMAGSIEPPLEFVSQYCPTKFSPMIVIGLMLYLVSFQSGLGPVPWIVNSEIYPLWFRSAGVSLSTGFNWALNIFVSYTFLYLVQAIDYGSYYIYAGFSFIAAIWFFFTLPETKGRTLEEMEQLFSKPVWRLGRG
eukprot:GFUD01043179.1.p1 GENE.GFUD01043179.1~~GFUD01043179.1.p1  ORF type:complete len:609 (+),score=148.19 GFUD01043179.1:53-1879(+)